jgi:hypothetical protein
MDDPDARAQWNRHVDRALLQAQLGPTAHALREQLGAGWTSTVDATGYYRSATLRHANPDYAVVLHISTVAGYEGPLLHITVWQDFNTGDHHASALLTPDPQGFDPDRVHAAVRQAVADTDRLKAHAAAHAAAQAILADTLRRLRHENPHGLLTPDHHHLTARYVADLAEARTALRDA